MINVEKLGALFEKASIPILKELFLNWGYDVVDSHRQKSGTQHGYDLYFKIARDHSFLNVFIECKASHKDNSISGDELLLKLRQFDWAEFPKKDIHIFFSPTRDIDLSNQLPTIEDDSYPFVIINWMRKADGENLIRDLFAAYRDYGTNAEILAYCDYLFSEPENEPETIRTFAEVCGHLKQKFDNRVAEHNGKLEFKNFRIINGTFWSEVLKNTHSDFISYFYTKTDSTPARLREVVANDFYVKNVPASENFDRKLGSAIKTKTSLIKILSRGGEGKSTFLYHLAKTYCEGNIVVWLEDTSAELLVEIERKIKLLDSQKPVLFFLDNPAVFGKTLRNFAEKLTLNFRSRDIVLIVAERDIRYEHIEEVEGFESLFDEPYEIRYYANKIREDVFDKLISVLDESNSLSDEIREGARKVFVDDKRKSLAEGTFAVLKYLYAHGELKGYKFDWEDWEKFTKEHRPELESLYLIVATFYQFGFSLDIDFCVSLIQDPKANFMTVNSALTENPNLPIYKKGRHLLLRHETIASWYLDGGTEKTKTNLENSLYIFKTFLETVDTPFARDLFIWVCLKSREFRLSEYAKLFDENTAERILSGYIEKNPNELKARTELGKIYQKRGRWDEAESILLELKVIDPGNLQARTELSKIYQKRGRWDEAESILLESLNIDNQQLHPRTELSKIYQKRGRWDEAESILLELKVIDPGNLQARTELSKIYQFQRKWKEAEDILLESLKIDDQQLHPRTELSKIYQVQKKWQEGEDVLLESLKIDDQQLHPRTELSKIYQVQKKWQEAEDILLESLKIDDQQLHPRTELSKIYQVQKKWTEAEDILLECIKIDPNDLNSRTELSKVYQKQDRLEEAARFLEECLKIKPDDVFFKLELASIYEKTGDFSEREKLLFEIYGDHPENIPALTQLAHLFRRFKKYRVAVKLVEKAFEVNTSDLLTVCALIQIYSILRDNAATRFYYDQGEKILSANPYNKHRERFERMNFLPDKQINLIEISKIGHADKLEGKRYIKADIHLYEIPENAVFNNKVTEGDKVFFGLYSRDGQLFANFIEPYFDSIDDLKSLK